MKTIIILCYGVTFLTAASSLKCENCTAPNAATCSGTAVTCDSSVTSCISSLIEITYESATIQIPQKLCGIPGICNFSYSITLNDTHIASTIQCCTSDNCNTDLPQIAPRNLTRNGLKCPYCIQPGLGGCRAANYMLCTGLETMCINFSGNLDLGDTPVDISYQGCATQSACPANPASPADINSDFRLSCTKALHHCSEEEGHNLPVIS